MGRQYFSNSDIGTLLSNPAMYGVPRPDNPAFAKGRLFHQLILEPEKAADVDCVDTASRNSKMYKDTCTERGMEFMLLCKEMDEIQKLVSKMMSNLDFYDAIRADGNIYEQPAVATIKGQQWKGKADILGTDRIIDLKTTGKIDDFKYSARKYNYDSQCYIYETLFGRPMMFFAIDKTTGTMGMFEPGEEFLLRGEQKVERALAVHAKFFGPEATETIDNYYITQTL